MGLTYLVLTVIWFAFYIFLIDKISAFMKKTEDATLYSRANRSRPNWIWY